MTRRIRNLGWSLGAAALTCMLPLSLAAQGPGPMAGGLARRHFIGARRLRPAMMLLHSPRLRKALQLTAAQISSLRRIGYAARRQAIVNREQIALARLELHRALRGGQPALATVNAQLSKLGLLRTQARIVGMDAWLQARAVFTPAQRKIIHRFLRRQRMRMLRWRRMQWQRHAPARWRGARPGWTHRQPPPKPLASTSELALPQPATLLPADWHPESMAILDWSATLRIAPPPVVS